MKLLSGNTRFKVRKKFNIAIQKLRELNNLDDNTLSVGQKIIYSIDEEKIENNEVSNEFSTSLHHFHLSMIVYAVSSSCCSGSNVIHVDASLLGFKMSFQQSVS